MAMSAFIGNDISMGYSLLEIEGFRRMIEKNLNRPFPGNAYEIRKSLPNEGIFNFKEIVEFNKGKDLEKKFTCISRGTENSRHILEQNESW